MRELVFGSMPEGASPSTHKPAGIWCFTGRENLFPGWDEPGVFDIPADPYPDAAVMSEDALAANAEAVALIRHLGDRLNDAVGVGRSDAFWQMALGPWAVLLCHSTAERRRRLLDLIADPEPLRVALLPRKCPFAFMDGRDFMIRGVLAEGWNHYLFSRLIEAHGPKHWEISYLPARDLTPGVPPPEPTSVKTWLRDLLRALPFPYHKSFSPLRNLQLNLAVLRNKTARPDKKYSLERYGCGGIDWGFDFHALAERALPRSFESSVPQSIPPCRLKLRGITAAAGQDDLYRLQIASWLEAGASLFCVQHGANYGNLASVGGAFWEYACHAFITWGWREHPPYPINAVPLPQPVLAHLRDRHKETGPNLILVGTEMSSRIYRLKTRPQGGELPDYRRSKIAFFRALEPRILAVSSYRPYLRTPGGLSDGDHLRAALPQVPLCRGDLTAHLLSCRLLVLDHYGTTLHQALAGNVPTVAFWNRKSWAMAPETDQILDALAQAGILQPDADAAARLACTVWDDVPGWWRSEKSQEARRLWLFHFAQCGLGPEQTRLSPKRLARLWAKALRRL